MTQRIENNMKNKHSLSLLTLGLALIGTVGWAQTTPTGTATSTTHPVGAITEDSAKSAKPARSQRRAAKRADRLNTGSNQNTRNNGSSTTSNPQDGQYRQSSAADGTAVNNSNSTNYNSNNVTNAPTGVGSNPTVVTNPTTVGGTADSGSGTNTSAGSTTGEKKTGTSRVITGNSNSTEPANTAGSTERTTTIHDFIASSPNYITLQNALQSTDLNDKLKQGAYMFFAPTNNAFKKLPASVQAGLLEGRNRDALTQLLSYHLVEGMGDANDLTNQIKAGNGKAQLKTLAGGMLTAEQGPNGKITLTDEQGKKATVVATDKIDANGGIIYGLDSVLMPKNGAASFR
jgi:uncharacterized surface protein with fasciclin (FAS1) repeats